MYVGKRAIWHRGIFVILVQRSKYLCGTPCTLLYYDCRIVKDKIKDIIVESVLIEAVYNIHLCRVVGFVL